MGGRRSPIKRGITETTLVDRREMRNMGIIASLDDVSTVRLVEEVRRRSDLWSKDNCWYCGRHLESPDCRIGHGPEGNPRIHLEPIPPVMTEVLNERIQQDQIWGQQNHSPLGWLAVLAEEFGEFAADVTKSEVGPEDPDRRGRLFSARRELIQTAAVAVAVAESLDRNELSQLREAESS